MSEQWVMQVLAQPSADVVADKPLWLMSYDLDAFDGVGRADMTEDINEAMRFSSSGEVLKTWRLQSPTRPIRPDGKANRPLTALTISPAKVDS